MSNTTSLLQAAEELRRRLTNDRGQLEEIYELYARFLAADIPFPLDIEEHSLRLILEHLHPGDKTTTTRLVEVLRAQGKAVPDHLVSLSTRNFLETPEEIASTVRLHDMLDLDTESEAKNAILPLHDRLVWVFGLPKSASRLMVKTLAAMHPHERFRIKAEPPYLSRHVELRVVQEFNPDVLEHFEGGGVVHGHASATGPTRTALMYHGIAHVITVRHPADHVAALYCHIRRNMQPFWVVDATRKRFKNQPPPSPYAFMEAYGGEYGPNYLSQHHVIFPLDGRFFGPSVDVDTAVAHLIVGGYLYHALSWIVEWQLLRVRTTSHVVRYEDFIENPEQTLKRLNSVIFGNDSEAAVARGLGVFGDCDHETDPDADIYPRGPTNYSGVWKEYLSDDNRRLYNETCTKFVQGHPYGRLIERLYGDLLIGT